MGLREWLAMELIWEQHEYDEWVRKRWNKYRFLVLSRAIWILHGITILADVVYLFWGRQNVWLSLLCLLCLVAYLVLSAVFPAYFSVIQVKRDPNGLQIGLGLPLLLHMLLLISFTVRDFVMNDSAFFSVMMLLTLVIGGFMLCFVPEVRVPWRGWLVAVILFGSSYGIVGQLNYVTDFSRPQPYMTEITDVDVYYGRHHSDFFMYGLEVILKDGRNGVFHASLYEDDEIYVGKKIVLQYREGGLGLEYVQIGGMYEGFQSSK